MSKQITSVSAPSFWSAIQNPANFRVFVFGVVFGVVVIACFAICQYKLVFIKEKDREISISSSDSLPKRAPAPVSHRDDNNSNIPVRMNNKTGRLIQKAQKYIDQNIPELEGASIKWYQQPYGFEGIAKKESGQIMEVEFNHNGDWIETEWENLDKSTIPEAILARIDAEFGDVPILEYELEHTAGGYYHEIEIQENGQEHEYYFDEHGEFFTNLNEDKVPGKMI